MTPFRLFVLGDPHITPSELPLWNEAIDDINALAPDAVLVVGDLTGEPLTGTREGTRQAVEVLSRIAAPWHAVIGNHDLQGADYKTDAEAVNGFLENVGRKTPWFSQEMGPVTVIGLSNTQFRQNPVTPHEIVLNDEQIAWCRAELKRNEHRPVVILCHAPPIGSGLLTLSELHCYVGNAFVNQNHAPGQVQQIIREHPNILFWFSGHNHMGQHYRDAISCRVGVHFIHTAVVSKLQSRDGHRQSRLLELRDDGFLIRTFDHTLRRFDESLDRHEPHGLAAWMDYRKTMLLQRMMPMDPATMRQGPGPQVRKSNAVRFAFLSDAHVVEEIGPVQRRLIDWCIRQVRGFHVDRVVLGGDITHHANPAQAEGFIDRLSLHGMPFDYLPGNNEGPAFAVDPARYPQVHSVRGCEPGGTGWPERVFLLQTTGQEDATASVEALLERLPAEGNVLVLAHFPPETLPESVTAKLHREKRSIWWVCGHRHAGRTCREGNLTVTICGGLDPVKVRGHLPEMLIADWDGNELRVQTLRVPEQFLAGPAARANKVGLACRGTAEELIGTALSEGIDTLQFHYSHSQGVPGEGELAAVKRFRERFPQGFLSLHLPNFPDREEGPSLADQEPWLTWAEAMGLDDLTVHLPKGTVGRLFDEHREILETPWARQCVETYIGLAERAIGLKARLSLENIYNAERVPPAGEKISSRPWHLLRFVKRLRSALVEKGYSPEEAESVGIIFDAGHAFSDATVAKVHGLADWVQRLSPYLHLAHIHQVATRNHQPITDRVGPRINYAGLLRTIEEVVPRPVPLLIEVRDREEALASLKTVRGGGS